MHHKNRVEETRVRISLYPLLSVQPPDLILSSLVSHATLCCALHARRAAARHLSAFRNGTVRSDFSFPAAHGLEIVTTCLIVRQLFMNARLDLYMGLLFSYKQRLY